MLDAERFARVEQIYLRVVDSPPERRSALLEESCSDDPELLREVESLLEAREEAGSFLSPDQLCSHIEKLGCNAAVAAVGSTLGPYRILAEIGSGAMGDVYRARDSRLDRELALKVLPSAFTNDAERVARFRREAKAASGLNHLNIVTIYEIGQVDEIWFIAQELIEGVTLRERLSSGKLPMQEAIEIGFQCAMALEAAHRAGIVHRDIKPENVMVRPDGVVKIVDFGLARIGEAGQMSPHATQVGSVIGTPRYMSPEQARGEKLDARSDIFSLGAVLFEMVYGYPAFPGASTAEVFAALLDSRPVAVAGRGLGAVLSKALAKDREGRYCTIREFAEDLRQLDPQQSHGLLTASANQNTRTFFGRHANKKWYLAAALAVASVLFVWRWATSPVQRTREIATTVPLTPLSGSKDRPRGPIPLTGMEGFELYPAFSPDGKQLLYTRDMGDGRPDLYVKLIGGGPPLRLPTVESANMDPAWSPDGLQIAFLRSYLDHVGVFIMSALAGTERLVTNISDPLRSERTLTWTPDQKALIVTKHVRSGTGPLWLYPLDASAPRQLTSPPDHHDDVAPAYSRDGKTLAFIRMMGGDGELFLLEKTGEEHRIAPDLRVDSLAWSADGQSILCTSPGPHDRAVWRVRRSGGNSMRVSEIAISSPFNVTIAGQGSRMAFCERVIGTAAIFKLDITGKTSPRKLIASSGSDTDPSFSPDGRRVAFASTRSGSSQIWVAASDGSNPIPLTSYQSGGSGSPRWSPDGKQLAFDHGLNGGPAVFVINANGGAARELVRNASLPAWSASGQWIYFTSNRSGSWQIWKTLSSGGASVQATQNGGFECLPSFDGRFLYYTKGRDRAGIWRMPAEGGVEIEIPSLRPVVRYRYWSGASTGIYFLDRGKEAKSSVLKLYRFANRRVEQVLATAPPPMESIRGLSTSTDGRQVLWVHLTRRFSQILLVEGFR